jgi:tetratricopeptide (TPR) repeat protein
MWLSSCVVSWLDRQAEKATLRANDRKTIKGLLAFAAVMCATYVHMVNWGGDSISIVALRIRQATSTLSARGYGDLAQACVNANNWGCADNAYTQMFKVSKDPADLNKHASFLVALKRYDDAMNVFSTYFKEGGSDGGAMLEYARLLETKSKDDDALRFYVRSVKARPELLSVNAESGIVRILMKQGKYKQALRRIQAFHESAGNAKGYLNTELEQLQRRMGTVASRGVANEG